MNLQIRHTLQNTFIVHSHGYVYREFDTYALAFAYIARRG